METVSTHEAQTRFSELLDRVANGEEFLIAEDGKPLARLVGLRVEDVRRTGGQWKGRVHIGDKFDDALPAWGAGPLTPPL